MLTSEVDYNNQGVNWEADKPLHILHKEEDLHVRYVTRYVQIQRKDIGDVEERLGIPHPNQSETKRVKRRVSIIEGCPEYQG